MNKIKGNIMKKKLLVVLLSVFFSVTVKLSGQTILSGNASNLSSGIYFYKIVNGKYSEIKKMILLR